MKIAIVQPYLFPYLGYFQLINAVDEFVFYDDVNFIKNGWIHRNNVLVNGKPKLFIIPCINKSQNKLIKDIYVDAGSKMLEKMLKMIETAYKMAPYFDEVFPIIKEVTLSINEETSVSDIAIKSILETCKFLKIDCQFSLSSEAHNDSIELKKEKRIIHICNEKNALTYINPIGGLHLYSKNEFEKKFIQLKFLNPLSKKYNQFENHFISNLSIIDVMMFNSYDQIKKMLSHYELT